MTEDEIKDLLSLEYCNEHFGAHFPILKEVPAGADQETVRRVAQVNGYNRWSTRHPISTDFGHYLVSTQWYERSRNAFQRWLQSQRRLSF